MGQERDVDVSRRDLAALFGALGGAVGLSALASCSADGTGATAAEQTGSIAQAWVAAADAGASGTTVLWVDTIVAASGAYLRNTPGTDSGSGTGNPSTPVAIVGGYGAPGDGGGGLFYWDVSAQNTGDDGGTIIVPTLSDGGAQTAGRWKRIYSGSLNVKWFGATGDGATPDDQAIQRSIAAASGPNKSNTVFFPPGKYLLNSTLTIGGSSNPVYGVILEGAYKDGNNFSLSTLQWGPSAPSTGPMVLVRNADQGGIRKLSFNCASSNATTDGGGAGCAQFALQFTQVPYVDANVVHGWSVEQCTFLDAASAAVVIGDTLATDAQGDLVGITFRSCVWFPPTVSSPSTHVLVLSQNAFGIGLYDPIFMGGGNGPTNFVTIPAGDVCVYNGIGGGSLGFEFYLPTPVNFQGTAMPIVAGGLKIYGYNSQSSQFLSVQPGDVTTDNDAGMAPACQLPVVLSGIQHMGVQGTSGQSISWARNNNAILQVQGCQFGQQISLSNTIPNVFFHGMETTWTPNPSVSTPIQGQWSGEYIDAHFNQLHRQTMNGTVLLNPDQNFPQWSHLNSPPVQLTAGASLALAPNTCFGMVIVAGNQNIAGIVMIVGATGQATLIGSSNNLSTTNQSGMICIGYNSSTYPNQYYILNNMTATAVISATIIGYG